MMGNECKRKQNNETKSETYKAKWRNWKNDTDKQTLTYPDLNKRTGRVEKMCLNKC